MKYTLMYFDGEDDLLHGIDVLQHYGVLISEVYAPKQIAGIEKKLRIKDIRLGNAVLKYGFMGGAAITTLACYILEHGSLLKPIERSDLTLLMTVFITAITLLFASRLLLKRVPQMINSRSNDNRYLMVVNARGIIPHDHITNLFQYTEAVEISPAIKNIVIS
jgi:hypothetical protein